MGNESYPLLHTVSGIKQRTDMSAKQKEKILGENAALGLVPNAFNRIRDDLLE